MVGAEKRSSIKITHEKRYQEVILCLENLAVMLAESEFKF